MAICPLCQAMSSDAARACESCGAAMTPLGPAAVPGRARALAAFLTVSLAYVVGLFGFFYGMAHSNTNEELRSSSRLMSGTATFAMLCDLMAIVLGATVIPRRPERWARARAFGVASLVLGILGVIGAALLLLLASLFKDCASCNGCGSLSGIGSAVAR